MKHTNYFSNASRAFTLLTIAGASLFFASCDKDDDTKEPDPEPTMTIMEIIEDTEGLDSLEKYLNFYPDLVGLFSGTAEYTVFAPDNEAFAALLQTTGFPEDVRDINPDIIKGVLVYHAYAGTQLQADLTNLTELTSLYRENENSDYEGVTVGITSGVTTLANGSPTSPNTKIKEFDKKATNGVVHIVERVLIPYSVGSKLAPLLGTVGGTIMLSANFTYLAGLVTLADSDVPDASIPIVAYLTSSAAAGLGDTNVTIFAPANSVLEGTAEALEFESVDAMLTALGITTPAAARALLLNHLVLDLISADEVTAAASFTTVSGNNLFVAPTEVTAQTPQGLVILLNGNQETPAPVFVKDALESAGQAPASNGYIHVTGVIR